MADDERLRALTVQIEANTRGLEKAMQRVEKQVSGSLGKATASAKRDVTSLETAMSKASRTMDGFGRAFVGAFAAGFSIRAAQQLIDSATRIKNALAVAGLEGKELTHVYNELYKAAQRNGVPLEALAMLYGRAAQNQRELGVSTEQLVKFTDNVALALRVAGTDATQASGALLQLGQALGSGTVHAEEFGSVLEGAPTIAQAAAAGIKEANGSVAALKQLVVDGKISSKAFFDGFAAGADTLAERAKNSETTISAGFVRLQNVLVDVAKRFDDSTHASRTLAHMIDDTLIPAIQELGGIFSGVTNGPIGDFYNWLGKTIDRVVQLSADLGALTGLDKIGGNPYIGPGRIQERIDTAFAGTNYTTPKTGRKPTEITVTKGTVEKPITLADYPVTGAGKGKGSGGSGRIRRTADDRFEADIQAIKDRTEALQMEREAIGLNFREQQKREIAFELEKQALHDVQDAARQKGDADWKNVQLSKEQKDQIDAVSDAYARQADELRKAQEAQELSADVLKGAFDGIRTALEDGKITAEEWGNIVLDALDKISEKNPCNFEMIGF